MPIGIEQLDLQSLSRIFALKKDIEDLALETIIAGIDKQFFIDMLTTFTAEDRASVGINVFDKGTLLTMMQTFTTEEKESIGIVETTPVTFDKQMLIDLLMTLTEQERIDAGLIPDPVPQRPVLRALVQECGIIIDEAVAGTAVGEYSQSAIDVFASAISDANSKINSTAEVIDQAIIDLTSAKEVFELSQISDSGVLVGDTWYGVDPPTNPEYSWVSLKILSGKYWVSLEPINPLVTDATNLSWIYGIYEPVSGKVYTRFDLPEDITENVTRVNGGIFNNRWFGSDIEDATDLSVYLGIEIGFVNSIYQYVQANPPLVPKAGYAWYGSEMDMQYLPSTVVDSEKYLNIVAAFGS